MGPVWHALMPSCTAVAFWSTSTRGASNALWATLGIILVGLPAIFVIGQAEIHKVAHTPRITGGFIVRPNVVVVVL
jgi:hypothetical protein